MMPSAAVTPAEPKKRSHRCWSGCGLFAASLLSAAVHAQTVESLHYDQAGNIDQKTTDKGTTTYQYDVLNRLKNEQSPTGTLNYGLDANGNRASDNNGNYNYSPNSNKLATRLGQTVSTDNAGNITADGTGLTFTYNQAGKLKQVFKNGTLVATYSYNALGQRTTKVTPSGTTVYHYDLQGHLIQETTAAAVSQTTYLWRDDTPTAIIYAPNTPSNTSTTQEKIVYVQTDSLNTPRRLTDANIRTVWRWDGDAFGNTAPNQDPNNTGKQTIANLRFPGMYYDQETGLYYNGQRYYDPAIGRYLTSDPIGVNRDLSNPILQVAIDIGLIASDSNDDEIADDSLNQVYAYVNNNPLSFIDPYGLWHYGPGAHGPVTPQTNTFLQCMDTCLHRDLCVTSANDGTHSGPNDPHFAGQAADVGKHSNAGLGRNEVEQCYRQCSAQDPFHKYGQEEGNHFHFQTRPGRGGAHGFAGGVH